MWNGYQIIVNVCVLYFLKLQHVDLFPKLEDNKKSFILKPFQHAVLY